MTEITASADLQKCAEPEDKPSQPAVLEIIEELEKIHGYFESFSIAYYMNKHKAEELYKTMVRLKRIRDEFEKQKERCVDLIKRDGESQIILDVIEYIDDALHYIRCLQDEYIMQGVDKKKPMH
ncbi:GL15885 [Drosophila persimilis]|uniref:GL15885 n=1 Tax=Drosophila persimilis TaxID=7234 RepID=B4H0Z1_DROPE|nr:GL15885 [Drosophila persimilis]